MGGLSHLVNPLSNPEQLAISTLQVDGDLSDSIRFESSRVLQAAGVLLRLPQEIIAQSIVILARFWAGDDGRRLLEDDAKHVFAAALYLVAKPSAHPVAPRQLLTVFAYLGAVRPDLAAIATSTSEPNVQWTLSEGEYEGARSSLYKSEARILRLLGFQTHVALPYTVCINYLQTLDVFGTPVGTLVAKRAFAHLNSALLSPQLLYLTHQPSAVATAAIYLAARETDAKLPEVEWWEVFDVDREELGFLVVALRSMDGFALEEKHKWSRRKVPLTVEDLRAEMESRQLLSNRE